MLMTTTTRFRYTVRYTSNILNLLFLKVILRTEVGEIWGKLGKPHQSPYKKAMYLQKKRCIPNIYFNIIIGEVPQPLATRQAEVDGFSINYYDGCYVNTRD